jgi:CRISPR-associated protein Cpf1
LKRFANGKKVVDFPERTDWTVCSNVERFRWNRKLNAGKGGYEHYSDLTNNFHSLFASVGIGEKDNIKAKIADLEPEGNERFFRDFMFLFSLVCQIRNTDPEAKDVDKADFILSPVAPFFDSRKTQVGLPKNGDENGAYNIARKGIVILDKISSYKRKNGSCDGLKWGDLYVSHKEWDDFARKHASVGGR